MSIDHWSIFKSPSWWVSSVNLHWLVMVWSHNTEWSVSKSMWVWPYLSSSVDIGIEVLAKGCRGLVCFHSRGCVLLGDDALTHLARYCCRLRRVNIQNCVVITLHSSKTTSFMLWGKICLIGCDWRGRCSSGPKLSRFKISVSFGMCTSHRRDVDFLIATLSAACYSWSSAVYTVHWSRISSLSTSILFTCL